MANKKTGFIDSVVSKVSPKLGAARTYYRKLEASYNSYKGASGSRSQTSRWWPFGSSARHDLNDNQLGNLRKRSRDLSRNNPLARGALKTAVSNIVGTGIKARPTLDRVFLKPVLGDNPETYDELEYQIGRLFSNWASSKDCDAGRRMTFYELQSLVQKSYLESGDVFALRRYKNHGQLLGTCFQILEGDRVQNPNGKQDTSKLAAGVYMDNTSAPTAYSISKYHPGDIDNADLKTNKWSKITAYDKNNFKNVMHMMFIERPEQIRGEPWFAPVVEQFKMLERFTDAELQAAVVGAMFAVFIKSDEAIGLSNFAEQEDGAVPPLTSDDVPLKGGIVAELGKGQSIETAEAKRPSDKFDPFVQAIMRQIGAGLEIPFEVFIKHYVSSYSAARAAILDAYKFFLARRKVLESGFCQPAYESVIAEAVANGFLKLPGFFDSRQLRDAYLKVVWVGQPMAQIDELKEVKAATERVTSGFTSKSEEIMRMTGQDFDVVAAERAKEFALEEKLGLISSAEETDEEDEEDKDDQKD